MSKFNNAAKTLGTFVPPVASSSAVLAAPPQLTANLPAPQPTGAVIVTHRDSFLVTIGFALLCALMLSGYLNDWSYRLLGGKAYLSTVCIILVPAVWCISGHMLAPLKDRIGLWWLALMVLLLIGLPFSIWRSDSLLGVEHYFSRSLGYFFYVATFATNWRRVRTLVIVNIISGFIGIGSCALWGSAGGDSDERFRVPDSIFLSNSNELAMQLVLAITYFLFLFYTDGKWKKVIATAGIVLSLLFLLKTGSRGCLLSAAILFIVLFSISNRKLQFLLLTVPLIGISFAFMPAASRHRFTLMFGPDNGEPMTMGDMAAVGSTMQRKELLNKSLQFTVQHPLFGVGFGEFATAYTGEAEKQGKFAPWLGTHNSYTQISSECGIPAFICYLAVIVLTFRRTYGIYRASLGKPELRELNGLALSLFCGILVYALATFFFHMAYTPLLPVLSGQALALHRAAESLMGKPLRSTLATSN